MSIYPAKGIVDADNWATVLRRQVTSRSHLQRALAPILAGDFPTTSSPVDFR
jgi:hypothetical protein